MVGDLHVFARSPEHHVRPSQQY